MNGILLQGNALHLPLADQSVHCVVTSPPYYGQRDYGVTGQIGLEDTPQAYIERLVAVFREVKRVLRDDGVMFVNMGDTYASSGTGGNGATGGRDKSTLASTMPPIGTVPVHRHLAGFKPKSRLMMPARLAIALQDDGWIIRSEIVWHKPGPMPGSYRDRPTDAHEMVYMLTKNPRYWSDFDALRTPIKDESAARLLRGIGDSHKHVDGAPGQRPHSMSRPRAHHSKFVGTTLGGGDENWTHHSGYFNADGTPRGHPLGANIRTVWSISNSGFAGNHYAAFPPELARRCIVAGCPEKTCPKCGKGWVREVKREALEYNMKEGAAQSLRCAGAVSGGTQKVTLGVTDKVIRSTIGFYPSCICGCEDTAPGVVLDPFMGSGTTALVARQQGRRYVGVELSAVYNALAQERLRLPFESHHVRKAVEPLKPIDYGNGEIQPPLFQLEDE